jgi:hypothetical protein
MVQQAVEGELELCTKPACLATIAEFIKQAKKK